MLRGFASLCLVTRPMMHCLIRAHRSSTDC
ncbi:hypothetical protein [Klebsiella phage Kpn02]|uniref:Uncharacterized protein n=1 Tax=Klebsiella phage Kpn02 TaxID=3044023 RepID=A0AAT9V602_9CAUD|nr:hypothetical protein [Klebsiella phage Kpn02]